MVEAVISVLISLVVTAYGYGRLTGKIEALEKDLKSIRDQRIAEKVEAESFKKDHNETLTRLEVTLGKLERDVHYIKEKIDG